MVTEADFKEITRGEGDATRFCVALYEFIHLLDDLVDKDKTVAPRDLVFVMFAALGSFATNPFFQKNREPIMAVLHASVVAYADSVDMENSQDETERVAAQIIKSSYQDVFYLIAFLCGGMGHQIAMSKKFRSYDINAPIPGLVSQKVALLLLEEPKITCSAPGRVPIDPEGVAE